MTKFKHGTIIIKGFYMRRIITAIVIALTAACLVSSCSSWRGTTLRITEDELQKRVSKKFPIQKSHPLLGTVTYENPRISLRRNDNRVELGIDISLSNITINEKNLNGSVQVLASAAYDSNGKALFLKDPQLQQFTLNGIPEQNVQMLSNLFMPAIEKLLTRKPVYRFKEQDNVTNLAGMLVKDIRVRDGCIEIIWGI